MTGPAKAYLKTERGDRIDCLFNPSELTVSKSNSWNAGQSKGRNAPELRFQGGQSATLSLNLTFDTTREGTDVTEYTTKLLDLMKSDPGLPGADRARNSGALRPLLWPAFHEFDLLTVSSDGLKRQSMRSPRSVFRYALAGPVIRTLPRSVRRAARSA